MIRTLRMAAFAACFIALSAAAQAAPARNGITNLAYSVQAGDSLYFTGKYQGKPVNLVRNGVIGSGKWTIYTGTLADRVRLTIDDQKGLQEMLSMDKGQRITVNRVGQERIEYRLYAPDRSFIIGSVLYRKKNRWLQGMMKTEAFSGYTALTDVSDVTKQFAVQSAIPAAKLAYWFKDRWQNFNLISTASADTDDLIRGFFSPSAQDTRNNWGAPLDEMWKGALVGAGAFTVKVIERGGGVGYLAEVAEVAVALPFIEAVVVGVGVGLAADKVYNWADTKQLRGTTSASDLFNRLVADTKYTKQSAQIAPPADEGSQVAGTGVSKSPAQKVLQPARADSTVPTSSPSSMQDMISMANMADMADMADKQDFNFAIDLADKCTHRRDFACTDEQLAAASKVAHGPRDRKLIAAARQNMTNEKSMIAEEERQHAEEVRRLAEAEERQRIAKAEQQRQQEAEASQSSGFQFGKAFVMGSVGLALGGGMSSEAKSKFIEGVLKDSMPGQDGISNTTANANAYAAEQKARQVANSSSSVAQQSSRVATTAVAADESWRKCGPHKTCLVGDGVQHFCSGPANNNKPMCSSGCKMDSLALYYDTTQTNLAGNEFCHTGTCNVVNSCD